MASEQLKQTKKDPAVYTTSNGVPYVHHPYGAQVSNPGGPLLLQDFNLVDSLAHFDAERIPERVVHAKGGGAHGYFELTDPLDDLTYARPLATPGYKCPVTCRFSTVGGERGTQDTLRDPRGFSIKFRTDIGNMDWVFNNTPVFFLRDPLKFPHFIHTQKRDPQTNLNQHTDSTHMWDYYTQNVETMHQVTYMFGDRGTPASWAQMNGYSGHTFKLVKPDGSFNYVQFHVLADEGFQTFTGEEAEEKNGSAPDYNNMELFKRIESGNFPSWTYYVQVMSPEQAEEFRYSINDLTKIWPHKQFPLRKFGKMVLDKNVENYHSEIEQIAFAPSHLVPGLEPSNDPVLQSRLFSYNDTHRHRLGVNYNQLPINRPRTFETGSGCPFLAGNFQRDGPATIDNQGFRPNYLSTILPLNSAEIGPDGEMKTGLNGKFVGTVTKSEEEKAQIKQQSELKADHEFKIWDKSTYFYISGVSELDVEQPRALYEKVFDSKAKKSFVRNIVAHADSITIPTLKQRVAQYWGLLDKDLGADIAKQLGVDYIYLSLPEYSQTIGVAPAY